MEADSSFAVFILTHGRPDKVITHRTLRNQGYTGDIYVVVDNEDKTLDKYLERFGDKVIVFDKLSISKTFDTGDNFQDRRAVIYARNACFEIAKNIGLDYFLELDDDYTRFIYKYRSNMTYTAVLTGSLDRIFSAFLSYFKSINALSVAMAQTGDFIGGEQSELAINPAMKRKCMNTFFLSPLRQFQFTGRVNEDVNTCVSLGNRGALMLTIPNVAIQQRETQSNSGGMSEMYLDEGTYRKSFYTIMYAPSCVKISTMGKLQRIHHKISWSSAVPCILNEKYKKQ